jgi:hypothetical protein
MGFLFFNISDFDGNVAEAVFSESAGDAYSSGINALK